MCCCSAGPMRMPGRSLRCQAPSSKSGTRWSGAGSPRIAAGSAGPRGARGRGQRAAGEARGAGRGGGGRVAASVVRVLGDLGGGGEVVQDSLLVAWERWRADGIPGNPSGWLWTVARRRALDVARRDVRYQAKLALLAASPGAQADAGSKDDRLALIFTCCHPALAPEAQVALTLRTVSGLSARHIAIAFLRSEPTVMQRLTRARRKIAAAGVPFPVPDPDHPAAAPG